MSRFLRKFAWQFCSLTLLRCCPLLFSFVLLCSSPLLSFLVLFCSPLLFSFVVLCSSPLLSFALLSSLSVLLWLLCSLPRLLDLLRSPLLKHLGSAIFSSSLRSRCLLLPQNACCCSWNLRMVGPHSSSFWFLFVAGYHVAFHYARGKSTQSAAREWNVTFYVPSVLFTCKCV